MARRNIVEYERILTVLDSGVYKDNGGLLSLGDIEAVFAALSDRSRPQTIRAHIDLMCRLKLLSKRGEMSYRVADNWKEIVKMYL